MYFQSEAEDEALKEKRRLQKEVRNSIKNLLKFNQRNHNQAFREILISAREKLAVCDVTNLPYMDIN